MAGKIEKGGNMTGSFLESQKIRYQVGLQGLKLNNLCGKMSDYDNWHAEKNIF